jgi:hypothetical protein
MSSAEQSLFYVDRSTPDLQAKLADFERPYLQIAESNAEHDKKLAERLASMGAIATDPEDLVGKQDDSDLAA